MIPVSSARSYADRSVVSRARYLSKASRISSDSVVPSVRERLRRRVFRFWGTRTVSRFDAMSDIISYLSDIQVVGLGTRSHLRKIKELGPPPPMIRRE